MIEAIKTVNIKSTTELHRVRRPDRSGEVVGQIIASVADDNSAQIILKLSDWQWEESHDILQLDIELFGDNKKRIGSMVPIISECAIKKTYESDIISRMISTPAAINVADTILIFAALAFNIAPSVPKDTLPENFLYDMATMIASVSRFRTVPDEILLSPPMKMEDNFYYHTPLKNCNYSDMGFYPNPVNHDNGA